MDSWLIVGMVGVIFTSLQLAPQVYKSLKTKLVRDVSLGLSLVVGGSAVTWLFYGIHLHDWPIIIANFINFLGAFTLYVLKIREKPQTSTTYSK